MQSEPITETSGTGPDEIYETELIQVTRTSNKRAADFIAERAEFMGSHMRGEWRAFSDTGRLSEEWAAVFRADLDAVDRLYVVYSRATPIAWYSDGFGWVVPDEKHSTSTSVHQSYARQGALWSGEPRETEADGIALRRRARAYEAQGLDYEAALTAAALEEMAAV